MFVTVTILAVPAYVSGEPAEDVVKGLPGVTHSIIGEHEEMAEVAITAQVVLGVGTLVLLIVTCRGKPLSNPLIGSILAAALIVSGRFGFSSVEMKPEVLTPALDSNLGKRGATSQKSSCKFWSYQAQPGQRSSATAHSRFPSR